MALNPHATAALRKLMVDAIIASCASGILRVMSNAGAQPASPEAAIGSSVVLAELTMSATAFVAVAAVSSTDYVVAANAITADSSANASGTASWFRLWNAAGTTALLDGTVGVSGCDLNINAVAIVAATTVSATGMSLTLPV